MKKIARLACLWTVMFSFTAQTTGAASLAMIGAPTAARNMMPPPSMQALQSVPVKAAAAPKVEPPAEWGFYVLAFGEIAVEEFLSGRDWVRSAWRLPSELATTAWSNAKNIFRDPAPAENIFAPIDLARLPAETPAAAPSADAAAPRAPEDRILIVPEPTPRSALGWLPEVVANFIGKIEPMPGAWIVGRGIRLRVTYLNPMGRSRADATGVTCVVADGRGERERDEVLPQRYWGDYAVYVHDSRLDYEIEVVNTGVAPLKNLQIAMAQEQFVAEGSGRLLPSDASRGDIPLLRPGESVRLRGDFRLSPRGTVVGHFEQTHVVISAAGEGGRTNLMDEPHAGLVDPPTER